MFAFAQFRPLRNAHWSLPVLLIMGGLLISLGQPCKRGPYYSEAIGLTVLICVVAWANHLAKAPIMTARAFAAVMARSLYDLAALAFLWMAASIPFAIFLPTYQCYTDRARASEVLLAASGLRSEVEAKAIQRGTTIGSGSGSTFVASGRARAGAISNDGLIVAIGDDPPVVFLLSPQFAEGKVKWKCQGYPVAIVPASCRGDR